MVLSCRDYRKALDIIDAIYSIPDQKAMIRQVCEELRKFIGIHSAVFVSSDPKTREFHFSGYEVFNNSEESMLTYLAHFAMNDPFMSNGWFKHHFNEAARITDMVPGLGETGFARDFLIPVASVFYGLGAWLRAQGDMVGIFIANRQKHERDFSRRDQEIVNILLPHVAMAIRNIELIGGRDPLKEACGVIMRDEAGLPVFMNDAARQAIKGTSAEHIPDPGLGSGAAFFKNGSSTFRVRTVPLCNRNKKGKFILLEPHPPSHRLDPGLDRFNLSRREKEIAVLVIQGHSNREIAERLSIREQTVKGHLNNIFGKFEIRRRSELAAVALGLRCTA
ncbi:MAG: helix-turn-helix transcriptional regulator [Nitrospiraceae bacterium]|nr:helix-turn-helix transcriptional regulator [Nitrospiraceae bacterium]